MKKDYTKYTAEDLLEDDFFIQSNLSPTLETMHFWNRQLEDGLLNEQEYKLAVFYLHSVEVKREEMSPDRQELLWERIVSANKAFVLNKNRRFRLFFLAAACLGALVVSSVSYLHFTGNSSIDVEMIARSMEPVAETEEVQLVLPDKKIPIGGQNSAIQHDAKGSVIVNSEKITEAPVTTASASKSPTEYNQLIVPNGKRSTLTFEDGTKLWVNAGSRVVYPVTFAAGKREIYVDGEVYLEVTPDKKRPFIVKTSDMSIKVLGTSFNVMSYEKDHSSSVVLVTGLVQIATKEKADYQLVANKMFSYRDGEGNVKEVNITDYISWKEGLYTYRSENLSVILNRLSRYYGEKITYNSEVAGLKCSGKLDMQGELGVVLDGLTNTAPVSCKKIGKEYVLERIGK